MIDFINDIFISHHILQYLVDNQGLDFNTGMYSLWLLFFKNCCPFLPSNPSIYPPKTKSLQNWNVCICPKTMECWIVHKIKSLCISFTYCTIVYIVTRMRKVDLWYIFNCCTVHFIFPNENEINNNNWIGRGHMRVCTRFKRHQCTSS